MFADLLPISGIHAFEHDALGPFAWTTGEFSLRLARAAAFARMHLCYYGDAGRLSLATKGSPLDEVPLTDGWQSCVLHLGSAAPGDELLYCVTPTLRVPGDSRVLGVMLRQIELFDDRARFERLRQMHGNLHANRLEYITGQTVLSSYPPQLRVNLEVRCNIPETGPACVYCAWDWAKESERDWPGFTLSTLDQLGDYYRAAVEVNDCAIGEPTMNRDFPPIVARLDADGKQLSLTTNGQLLTPARRAALLGKNLNLYVSIDSATAAGYARYRNDRFDRIIANLRALCAEKRARHNLPRVFVSLIVMRSNVAELPDYFVLMRDVGVDEVKLRALYLDDNLPPSVLQGGYRFDYADEIVPLEELHALTPQVRQLAAEVGLPVYIEWEQFAVDVQRTGAPLCSEPWKTLYVLGRGIMPCCYATEPLAAWHEQQGRPLDVFLNDVFNGPTYQDIRRSLASGDLADYCRRTPSCPILKAMQLTGSVDTELNAFQRRALGVDAPPLVPLEDWRTPSRRAA